MKHIIAVALALSGTSLAVAQTAAPIAPATDVDPERLKIARDLIGLVMPEAKRAALIDTMTKGMMANIAASIQRDPAMKAAFESDPRAGGVFQRFFQQQQASTIALVREGLPGMLEAMGRAYARRFTAAQMGELRTFFETPTGRLYIDQAATVVTDPDVAAWQRDLMTKSMTRIPTDAQAMLAEIKALKTKAKPRG